MPSYCSRRPQPVQKSLAAAIAVPQSGQCRVPNGVPHEAQKFPSPTAPQLPHVLVVTVAAPRGWPDWAATFQGDLPQRRPFGQPSHTHADTQVTAGPSAP